ncbi:MAG: ABC transporter permease [Verrucomicrobiota bacterium]
MNDVRYALRMLLKQPGFTVVAVLTLALGIGATTAIYSVVNAALLNPVAIPNSERLMQIGEWVNPGRGEGFFGGVAPPVIQVIRENQDQFEDVTWSNNRHLERRGEEFVETFHGAWVSPNYFSFLSATPMLGRGFARDEAFRTDEEGKVNSDAVIVLSHSLWTKEYGSDPNIIGRNLTLSERNFTVIGVMPAHFRFPWGTTDFWVPMADPLVLPNLVEAPNHQVLVRLKEGTTQEQAASMLKAWENGLLSEYANDSWQGKHGYGAMMRREGWSLKLRPMREIFTNEKLQRTMFGLLGAIVFVLMIVCTNIANLMLARTERRQQEMAVRAAIGAGRGRIVRQLLTESVLLAGLGGVAGLIATWWCMKLLISLLPGFMPRLNEIQIDSHALGFTLLVSLGTGMVFGLAPALRASRVSISETLKQGSDRTSISATWRRYRGGLVVTQVALTMVLLLGAGLMIQSVVRLLEVKPGFDPENLLRVHITLPWQKYANEPALKNPVLERLNERLAALPGVKAAGIGKHDGWASEFELEDGRIVKLTQQGCGVESSDLFRAMGTPLLAGRTFQQGDIKAKIKPVVINETMADTCWGGKSALGMKFGIPGIRSKVQYEVIGIVGDTRTQSYAETPAPIFYRPFHEMHLAGVPPHFIVRSSTDPTALMPAIRKEVKAAEPDMGVPMIGVVEQDLYRSTQGHRTYMLYLMSFAGVALFLSAFGIYGTLAYSVSRRTREIGIRMAVGAERPQILKMIIAEGGRLVGMGIIAGLIASYWLTRFIESQLFQVSPTEPVVYTAVVLFLLAIALLAAFLPARSAAKIEPMTALRYE